MLIATIPQRRNTFQYLFNKNLNKFPPVIHAFHGRNRNGPFVSLYDSYEEVSGIPVYYLGAYTANTEAVDLILEDASDAWM